MVLQQKMKFTLRHIHYVININITCHCENPQRVLRQFPMRTMSITVVAHFFSFLLDLKEAQMPFGSASI